MVEPIKAKLINPNFWILNIGGEKIGHITKNGNIIKLKTKHEEIFSNLDEINKKYKIEFITYNCKKERKLNLFGYPTKHKPINSVYDLKRNIPMYSIQSKSQCYYCAGYYRVKIDNAAWITMFCPKNIILKRNIFSGPFKTKEEIMEIHKNEYNT